MKASRPIVIKPGDRILLIVGPTSSGKTTLAHKLRDQIPSPKKAVVISHDDIVQEIANNIHEPKQRDQKFRVMLIERVTKAVADPKNDFIILDTVNISKTALNAFLVILNILIPSFSSQCVLLKTWIPKEKNIEFAIQHYPHEMFAAQLTSEQINEYESAQGSLHSNFTNSGLVKSEYVVNPLTSVFELE